MEDRIIITDFAGLTSMVEASTGRNRSVEKSFLATVDPVGNHVLFMQFVHNDIELRTGWLVKTKGTIEPTTLWLDIPFETFVENTQMLAEEEILNASRNEPTVTHG